MVKINNCQENIFFLSFCHCQFYALQKFLFPSATCYGQDSSDRLSVPVSNTRLWSWFWFVDDNGFEFIFDAFIKMAAYMCILKMIAIECIYVDG